MKRILLAIICLSLKLSGASAQGDPLMLDENNKYIYYQVVTQAKTPPDSLYERALLFLRSTRSAAKLTFIDDNKATGSIRASGGTLVRKRSTLSAHEDANINFNMVIEVKDGKYRYWFTDFVIVPYQRDRYANFVPVPGKSVPLEKGRSVLSQKDMDGYMQTLASNIVYVGDKLKSFMKDPEQAAKKEAKRASVTTKEW